MKQLLIFFYIILLCSNLLSSETVKIYKINYDKIEKDNIKLSISFLENYLGDIVQKSGNNFKKVILNNATTEDFLSKKLKNSFVKEMKIISSVTRTEFLFYSQDKIKIHTKQVSAKKIVIKISRIINDNSITPEGKSMFENLPLTYIIILFILLITVLIILFKNRKLDFKSKMPSMSSSVINTVVNNAALNTNSSAPSFSQPLRVPQQQNLANEFPVTKISSNENLEAINIQNEYPFSKNTANEQIKPHHQNHQSELIQENITPTIQKEQPKQKNKEKTIKVKKMLSSQNVKVIFDDDLDKGNVSMFQVGSRKYLIYEAENGELLLLDKFETIRKNAKKTPAQKIVTPEPSKVELSKQKVSSQIETASKQNFLNNNHEIPLPKLDNIENEEKKHTKSQINAIFD